MRVITLADASYPNLLREIADPPATLFARGDPATDATHVAIVGSRRCSSYGRRLSAELAGGIARLGGVIVSGGALGIDTAAHEGALEAEGRTVVVLGCGTNRNYPAENRDLFRRAAENGAIVTEFPPDTPPLPPHFPRRNRIISGLAAAVVVVEAADRSGSLITANHALDQGRAVLAVPGPVTSAQSTGCHRLLQEGARLVYRVDDIVEELSPADRDRLRPAEEVDREDGTDAANRDPEPDERIVLEYLDPVEPIHVEDLGLRVPFGASRLLPALFGLEVLGRVQKLPGGYYVRVDPRAPAGV